MRGYKDMRKLIAMLALLMLVFALTACGSDAEMNADLVITRAAEETIRSASRFWIV